MASLSLCLQSRQGRKVIKLVSTASTQELYESTSKEFGLGIQSLKAGFPPKPIPSDTSTPISQFVSNQERIQVEFASGSSAKKAPTKRKGKTEAKSSSGSATNDASSSSSRRSKRAASKAATESMPALIKAQEEYMKQTSPGKKRARGGKTGVHSIISSSNQSSKKPKSKPLSASAGAGFRLSDGRKVANPRATAQRRLGGEHSTDMSTALMGAIHDKGQMGIILRKGMKNAVLSSYETTRSFSRLAAIQAKSYQMENVQGGNNSLLKVSYQGSVDKTKVEESVDCIPRDVLQAVMEGIHASNKEALRPENLSKLSPRVLWSCVHYFPTLHSVPDMYKALLPNLDWGFLRRRAEQLSEKALENKRQAELENENEPDLERASQVVQAVEHAMEHLHDYHSEERKARQAQAAEARLRKLQDQHQTSWVLETPSEPDRDELRECIEHSLPTDDTSPAQMTKWISQLMKEHKIHNWRELALASDKLSTLTSKLQVPEANLKLWIDKAQSESVPEIMVEICDSNVAAVEILTAHARSGTPKDLAGWRSIPELLLDQLKEHQPQEDNSWMTLETISTWCDRAHALLKDYEWLNWYATPV